MTKEEISKAIEECEEKLKNLRDELNRPEYGGKRWKPKLGEDYFYVNACGVVFTDNYGEDDEEMYTFGNVYPTWEAADFEVERRKVIAELSDFAESDDAVWDGCRKHWYICWDSDTKVIVVNFSACTKHAGVCFPSAKATKAAVEAVGEERVKKYYLGVKE